MCCCLGSLSSFSLSFGETCGGFIGNPKTYFFFNNVGAAPVSTISANIPLALYAIFQLKVGSRYHHLSAFSRSRSIGRLCFSLGLPVC